MHRRTDTSHGNNKHSPGGVGMPDRAEEVLSAECDACQFMRARQGYVDEILGL